MRMAEKLAVSHVAVALMSLQDALLGSVETEVPLALSTFEQKAQEELLKEDHVLATKLTGDKIPRPIHQRSMREFREKAAAFLRLLFRQHEAQVARTVGNIKKEVMQKAYKNIDVSFEDMEVLFASTETELNGAGSSGRSQDHESRLEEIEASLAASAVRSIVRKAVLESFATCKEMPGFSFVSLEEHTMSPPRGAKQPTMAEGKYSDANKLIDEVLHDVTVYADARVLALKLRLAKMQQLILTSRSMRGAGEFAVEHSARLAVEECLLQHMKTTQLAHTKLRVQRGEVIAGCSAVGAKLRDLVSLKMELQAAAASYRTAVSEEITRAHGFIKAVALAVAVKEAKPEPVPEPQRSINEVFSAPANSAAVSVLTTQLCALQTENYELKAKETALEHSLSAASKELIVMREELLTACTLLQQYSQLSEDQH